MAKNIYDNNNDISGNPIDLNVEWTGDTKTEGKPLSGRIVQKLIKDGINSKVGYINIVEATGKYVLTRDKEAFDAYIQSIEDGVIGGDKTLIIGEFLAPFEYSASVELLPPTTDYAVVLEGKTGNTLKFKGTTKDSAGMLYSEAYTYSITFRNGGVIQTYNGRINKNSDAELNIDKYLVKGSNQITIMLTGNDTNASSYKSIEYRVIEMNLEDSFDISKVYNLTTDTHVYLTVNFKVKNSSTSTIKWFIDNELVDTTNVYTNTENGVWSFKLNKDLYQTGVHSLRFYMESNDAVLSNDTFRTDIFHRDFIVINTAPATGPMIAVSYNTSFDENIINNKKEPIFNTVQYENTKITFSVFNKNISSTNVNFNISTNNGEYVTNASYNTKNEEKYTHTFIIEEYGRAKIQIVADGYESNSRELIYDVTKSQLSINTHNNNVSLYLNANGKTNNSQDKDNWSFNDGTNTYKVNFNGFTWTSTNGWNNNKLIIANGSSIDIDFKPFADGTKLANNGATFEFEFSTINVYNENAIICNLCADNGAPGILITATEAKYIISKTNNSEVSVSTKFKSNENNRITFVITPKGQRDSRTRFIKIYVNGIICGIVDYDYNTSFTNNKTLHFEGTSGAEIEFSSLKFYNEALDNDQILDNYIFFRNDNSERLELFRKNNIYKDNQIDIDAIKQQIPIMIFKQRKKADGTTEGSLEDIETEYESKNKTVYFDIEYENFQNPTFNFKVERAMVRPQGTSSMKYPKKNFRFYTAKEDDTILYNHEGNVVEDRKYSFKFGSAPVNCWCLKADFAESSGTHNTGTARFWETVLKESGILTKAQQSAIDNKYQYDVRTTIDGFPIALFYQDSNSKTPRFIGKYNFNNDKSTEDVFGFTGGDKVNRAYQYYPIGNDAPIINDNKKATIGSYTDKPDKGNALFSKDNNNAYYMLRSDKMFDNPRMECWEILESGSEIALFKTVEGFGVETKEKKEIGRYYEKMGQQGVELVWEKAFESRFPDSGKYYHTNNLKKLCEWLVSCRYLKIDENGKTVNITKEDSDNDGEFKGIFKDTLTITSLSKYNGDDLYYEWDENTNSYVKLSYKPEKLADSDITSIADEVPTEKSTRYLVLKFSRYHDNVIVLQDNAENRKEKFRVEKYDHFDMKKMAAYYIYLLRFGGVDQTVKNAMLTTEGSDDNENLNLPSKWFFINYDNDTILGLRNDGRLVFDPYIKRETKVNGAFAYAGRESTMWNNFENDNEFMSYVSIVDGTLHQSTNALSYKNAIDMYNNKQSEQWCERIYNMDAQYKYIDSYISPAVSDTSDQAEKDYLFDVQGSRSAHRKWWLSKRFNIYDSKFVTGDFVKLAINFKLDNLTSDKHIKITSGEEMHYGIGSDNDAYFITNDVIIPGTECLLPIIGGAQIGKTISVYGAPNIEKLNIRDVANVMIQLELANIKEENIGTKLKYLQIGNKDNPFLKQDGIVISGWGSLEKCEEIDLTGIILDKKTSINDLDKLRNLRKLYASGTNIIDMDFAEGSLIEEIEAPVCLQSLALKQAPNITFENIKFYSLIEESPVIKVQDNNFGSLRILKIDNCANMMDDYTWIFNWLKTKKNNGENLSEVTLEMNGINWVFDTNNYTTDYLKYLEEVGTLKLKGRIHINRILSLSDIELFQSIFGENCFDENAELYISAIPRMYITGDKTIIEADGNHVYKIVRVGVSNDINFQFTLNDVEADITGNSYTINIPESNDNVNILTLKLIYTVTIDNVPTKCETVFNVNIEKRIYPYIVSINGRQTIDEKQEYEYNLSFTSNVFDENNNPKPVNGFMTYEWVLTGNAFEENYLTISGDNTLENCILLLNDHYDGTARLSVNVKKQWSGELLFSSDDIFLDLFITNPNTLFTEHKKPELFYIFKNAGLVRDGSEKITKSDLQGFTIADLCPGNKSIFKGKTEIVNFDEFQLSTITAITREMFSGCVNMTSINLPLSVQEINDSAFSKCSSLTKIDIKGTKIIGNSAFNECYSLGSVTSWGALETIRTSAFANCSSLGLLELPANISYIEYNDVTNPFSNCRNLNFGVLNNEKYFTVEKALYEKIDAKKFALIHMGKDTKMEHLIGDNITIYTYAYSMEYRTESSVTVPSNIVFNGSYTFNGSSGESITLNTKVNNWSKRLFSNTFYKGNYKFADGEVTIPVGCFENVKDAYFTGYTIPYGITTVSENAFASATTLNSVTLPSTLERLEKNAFYYCENLRNISYNGKVILNDDLYRVYLTGIYCKPDEYDEIKNNNRTFVELLKPIVSLLAPRQNGFVRIIKDGKIVTPKEENKVTIGGVDGVEAVFNSFDYWGYNSVPSNNEVYLNGNYVGDIKDEYTTLYLGNNKDLYEGYGETGYDFTYGVYDDNINEQISNAGWYYDARFNGIRSKEITSLNGDSTLTLSISGLSDTINNDCYIEYGAAFYITDKIDNIYYIINNIKNNKCGYNQVLYTDIVNKTIEFKYVRDVSIKQYVDSFIINKIGETLYSDPLPDGITENETRSINVNGIEYNTYKVRLSSESNIPNNTPVVVTDGNAHIYRKYWKGEELEFKVPKNREFVCYAEPYLTDNGKLFKVAKNTVLNKDENTISYEGLDGIEVINNVLCFYTKYNDYYINIEQKSGVWSNAYNRLDEITTNEILSSDTDGLLNSEYVLNIEKDNSLFNNAYNDGSFGVTFKAYIPSFIEIDILKPYLNEINNYLNSLGYMPLDFTECWTSETFDEQNAWLSNGGYADKNTVKNYYVFGRKINII